MSRPTRIYPGFYRWTLPTMIGETLADVTYEIRHMPEWSSSEKWAVTADVQFAPDSALIHLVKLTDVIERTYLDACAAVQNCAAIGFEWYPPLGCYVATSTNTLDSVKRKG